MIMDADHAVTPADGEPRGLVNDSCLYGTRASTRAEHAVDHAHRRASSARSPRLRSQTARARSAGKIELPLGLSRQNCAGIDLCACSTEVRTIAFAPPRRTQREGNLELGGVS